MKLSNFRIRDRLHVKNKNEHNNDFTEHLNTEKQSNSKQEQKLTSLLQSFENILRDVVNSGKQQIRQSKSKTNHNSGFSKDLEIRDRFVTVDLPELEEEKIDHQKLEAWIGEVCDQSLSVAFNYFVEKKMSYDQMKAFASESLLRNLVILADNYKITSQEIKFMDQTMNDNIFPYLKAKYPLAIQKQLNKALQGAVKSIDNLEIVTNDYFFTSEIYFEYRESGQYDDVIMTLLNQLMTRIDSQSLPVLTESMSNYKEFENLMTEIFQKSFDEEWMDMNSSTNKVKASSDPKKKEKYQQKVKEYTSYLIGRKISENTQMYTETDIKSQCLTIKSPTVLRILTKWCEELWNKFENQNYFMERTDGLALIKSKKIGLVFPWLKTLLTNEMKKQKTEILQFLKNIEQINYKQQIQLLENELQNSDCVYLERYQKISGKFACKIVNNVERFIIDYLNRLIHGLTKVSKECYKQMNSFPEYWPNPYNLISFNVSDLLRCKYSSRQREVLKTFKEIEKLSNENPQKFKLIKIKNRLKSSTNDILIIARLNNSLNCQIQISVNTSNSEFMNCSNKINHYIYELERSKFGPILEMCSIWRSCQKRSEIFNKLIKQEKPIQQKRTIQSSQCIKNTKDHNLVEQKHPFVCSQCSRHYYHSNLIVNHFKCKICQYWKCANCVISQNFTTQNRDFFFKDDQLKDKYKFCLVKNQVPRFGACIFVNQPKIEIQFYKKMNYNFKNYLIHLKNDEVAILKEVTSAKETKQFFGEYLVFELSSEIIQRYLPSIPEKNIISNLFIPEYITKCLKQEKQTLSILRQDHFTQVNLDKIVNENRQKVKCVESIEFSSTCLTKLDVLNPAFVNLKRLNLNLNTLTEFSKVCEFKKLEKIYISQNRLQEIPQLIGELKQLKQLDLYDNSIKKIPQSLTSLTRLTILNLSKNKITELPQNINGLISLKHCQLKFNSLSTVPSNLFKLKNVEVINLQHNNIQSIPDQFDQLSSLKELIMSKNKIKIIPQAIGKIKNLVVLDLQGNQIQKLPDGMGELKNLQKLNLSSNSLKLIPDSLGNLQKLLILNFANNQIELFNSCLFKLSNLKELNLSINLITQMQNSFDKLTKLNIFNIRNNKLKFLPQTLKKLPNLTDFHCDREFLESFDLSFYQDNRIINISNCKNLKQITSHTLPSFKNSIQEVKLIENNLEKYPEWIFQLGNVKKINITSNKITEIPDNFKNEWKTIEFVMTNNLLTTLPLSFNCLKLLENLDLQNNQFESFPSVICELVNLKKLNLTKNSLKSLPTELKNLNQLEQLLVAENQLETVPEFIVELTQLWYLKLNTNQIKQIPQSFCQENSSNKQLDLSFNQIEKIPKEINQMKKLVKLILRDNPIKSGGDEEHFLKVSLSGQIQPNSQKLKIQLHDSLY